MKLVTSRPLLARRVEFACCVLLLLVLTTYSKDGPTGPTEAAVSPIPVKLVGQP